MVGSYDSAGGYDAWLVAQHRDGDPNAFEELYNAYYQRLLRFVRKRVHEEHLVEDLAQEAFVKAYAKLDKLRDTTRFYPWVASIARRLIIDLYRGRGKLSLVSDLDWVDTNSPDARLLEELEQADLGKAMERIRGRHREVLELRVHDELSYEEIAEKLGVPVTTVPPLLHRARLALRREYLLLKAHEDTAAWLPPVILVPVVDLFRRCRDRAGQVLAYMPDFHLVVGSVAAVAITAQAWGGLATAPPARSRPAPAESVSGSSGLEPEVVSVREGLTREMTSASRAESGSGFPVAGPYRPLFRLGPRAGAQGREQDRHMPIYIEQTPFPDRGVSIGIDPAGAERYSRRAMNGDYEWLEGR